MASPDNQQLWLRYDININCSQGFCSIYCPQWCYIIFSPPPPFDFPDQESGSKFSLLVIAIIGVLVGAFLLVSYYTIVCKYFQALRRRIHRNPEEDLEANRNSLQNEQWHVATAALEEALIISVTVCKFKKADGLVAGTDCSVCLNEFQEDESLSLLPKCRHAFHFLCIDTWLQSHSNCPLCRANIVSIPMPPHLQSPEELSGDGSSPESRPSEDMGIDVDGLSTLHGETQVDLEGNRELEEVNNPKVGSEEESVRDIQDDEVQLTQQSQLSIADILAMDSNDDFPVEDCQIPAWTERCLEEQSKGKMWREAYTDRILHSVRAPVSMKRSFLGGKSLFSRHGTGNNAVIPV